MALRRAGVVWRMGMGGRAQPHRLTLLSMRSQWQRATRTHHSRISHLLSLALDHEIAASKSRFRSRRHPLYRKRAQKVMMMMRKRKRWKWRATLLWKLRKRERREISILVQAKSHHCSLIVRPTRSRVSSSPFPAATPFASRHPARILPLSHSGVQLRHRRAKALQPVNRTKRVALVM